MAGRRNRRNLDSRCHAGPCERLLTSLFNGLRVNLSVPCITQSLLNLRCSDTAMLSFWVLGPKVLVKSSMAIVANVDEMARRDVCRLPEIQPITFSCRFHRGQMKGQGRGPTQSNIVEHDFMILTPPPNEHHAHWRPSVAWTESDRLREASHHRDVSPRPECYNGVLAGMGRREFPLSVRVPASRRSFH